MHFFATWQDDEFGDLHFAEEVESDFWFGVVKDTTLYSVMVLVAFELVVLFAMIEYIWRSFVKMYQDRAERELTAILLQRKNRREFRQFLGNFFNYIRIEEYLENIRIGDHLIPLIREADDLAADVIDCMNPSSSIFNHDPESAETSPLFACFKFSPHQEDGIPGVGIPEIALSSLMALRCKNVPALNKNAKAVSSFLKKTVPDYNQESSSIFLHSEKFNAMLDSEHNQNLPSQNTQLKLRKIHFAIHIINLMMQQ